MERLTTYRKDGRAAIANKDGASPLEQTMKIPAVIDRLAAYEDTGLEPEEINDVVALCQNYTTAGLDAKFIQACIDIVKSGVPLDRLRELAEADSKGLVRILPYSVLAYKIYTKRNRHGNIHKRIVGCVNYGFPESEIGKTVFLTRESAEAALKAGDPA